MQPEVTSEQKAGLTETESIVGRYSQAVSALHRSIDEY